jgi:hypothetical protein
VRATGVPELVAAVERGEVSVTAAAVVAERPQRGAAGGGVQGAGGGVAKVAREARPAPEKAPEGVVAPPSADPRTEGETDGMLVGLVVEVGRLIDDVYRMSKRPPSEVSNIEFRSAAVALRTAFGRLVDMIKKGPVADGK